VLKLYEIPILGSNKTQCVISLPVIAPSPGGGRPICGLRAQSRRFGRYGFLSETVIDTAVTEVTYFLSNSKIVLIATRGL